MSTIKKGPAGIIAFAAILIVLVFSPMVSGEAVAQRASTQGSTSSRSGPLPAPVGHRQPSAQDVQGQGALTPTEERDQKLDRELNKKLNSICRGC